MAASGRSHDGDPAGGRHRPPHKGAQSRFILDPNAPTANPPGNLILAALPVEESESISSQLQLVSLRVGDTLHEPNRPITFGYFLNSGLVSAVVTMSDGATVEVGMTGREGFVGSPLLLGTRSTPMRTVVQFKGEAYRITANALKKILPRSPGLELLLLRCAQAGALQTAQIAACNSVHEVRQRLSRWLLMAHQRLGSGLLPVTQDSLAQVLGCSRSSIAPLASELRREKLITYTRGRLGILDRRGLEAISCECYAATRRFFAVPILG